jgi:positive regulator of sigma E activity
MNQKCRAGGGLLVAEDKKGLSPAPGELVEIEFAPGSALREGLLVILLPVAVCIAAFLLSGPAFPYLGEASRAAIGLCALFGTAAVLCLVRRFFPPKTIPRIAGLKNIEGTSKNFNF